MVCRFILGLTEAANYPACVKTTRLWFPAGERAVATGIFNAGTNVGAMFTPMLLPLVLQVWGWQDAFLCMAALGGIWLVFWGLKYLTRKIIPASNSRNWTTSRHRTNPINRKSGGWGKRE